MESKNNFSEIESSANFEGNATELLLERVGNPNIKKQIIDLIYRGGQAYGEFLRTQKFVPFGKPESKLIQDESGLIYSENELSYIPPPLERVEEMLNERITEATTLTNITFSPDKQSTEEEVSINWIMPGHEKKPTTKQMSIIEAHEKGHLIRPYGTDFFRDYFAKGFDMSQVSFVEKDFVEEKSLDSENKQDQTFEEAKGDFFRYIFSGPEIAERMSQLKNYFGLKGDELFTKEHLDYARLHYVMDTGFDNRVTPFLQAITPETEDSFLELINSSGI